ncbi:hypothetical protein C2G38_2053653 [Gigaspora rosea]|uniref:Uncharacterized protein n=1 Tax=Gigaspora rosea TaxID=44941 RepID=A0A397W8N6_9GLOM|nr:hypothetical protein C2G38_2053653 [Gigaspora rosea]
MSKLYQLNCVKKNKPLNISLLFFIITFSIFIDILFNLLKKNLFIIFSYICLILKTSSVNFRNWR